MDDEASAIFIRGHGDGKIFCVNGQGLCFWLLGELSSGQEIERPKGGGLPSRGG